MTRAEEVIASLNEMLATRERLTALRAEWEKEQKEPLRVVLGNMSMTTTSQKLVITLVDLMIESQSDQARTLVEEYRKHASEWEAKIKELVI